MQNVFYWGTLYLYLEAKSCDQPTHPSNSTQSFVTFCYWLLLRLCVRNLRLIITIIMRHIIYNNISTQITGRQKNLEHNEALSGLVQNQHTRELISAQNT